MKWLPAKLNAHCAIDPPPNPVPIILSSSVCGLLRPTLMAALEIDVVFRPFFPPPHGYCCVPGTPTLLRP